MTFNLNILEGENFLQGQTCGSDHEVGQDYTYRNNTVPWNIRTRYTKLHSVYCLNNAKE